MALRGDQDNRYNMSRISGALPEWGAVHSTTSMTSVTWAQARGLDAGLAPPCLHVHAKTMLLGDAGCVNLTTSHGPALLSSPDLQPVTSVKDFSTGFSVSLVTPRLSNIPAGLCIPMDSSPKCLGTWVFVSSSSIETSHPIPGLLHVLHDHTQK